MLLKQPCEVHGYNWRNCRLLQRSYQTRLPSNQLFFPQKNSMAFPSCSYPQYQIICFARYHIHMYICVSKEIHFFHINILRVPVQKLYAKPPMKWDAHSMTLFIYRLKYFFIRCVIIPGGIFVLVKILQCYYYGVFLGRTELQGGTAHRQLVYFYHIM